VNWSEAVAAVVRRWWLVVAFVVVAVAAVWALTPASATVAPRTYTASAILVVNPNANNGSAGAPNLSEATLETTVGAVPKAAAAKLHFTGNPTVLAGQVHASNNPLDSTLTISSSGTNPTRAALVANTFADALNSTLLATEVSDYDNQVASVENQLKGLQAQVNQYDGARDPIGQAKLGSAEDQYRVVYDQFQQLASQGRPQQPFNYLQRAVAVPTGGGIHAPRSRKVRLAIGALVGFLIGLAVALGLERIRPRIRTAIAAEEAFGVAVLAEVPNLSRSDRARVSGRTSNGRLAGFREAYRMLRTSIMLLAPEATDGADPQSLVAGPQVILVSSSVPGEGKTTTVANLAVAMAETGRDVVAMNADFRKPQLHASFGVAPGPGLTDLLATDRGPTHLQDLIVDTSVPGVGLIHSGTPVDNPAELFTREGVRLLDEARDLADVVLIDTAPVLVVSDASELLPAVDAVILVCRVGRTTRDAAQRSAQLLARAGIPLLGVVLIGVTHRSTDYYTRYGYGSAPTGPTGLRGRLAGRRAAGAGAVQVAKSPAETVADARSAEAAATVPDAGSPNGNGAAGNGRGSGAAGVAPHPAPAGSRRGDG
jgi:capsular exopolysaccharide synthesis family protein